MNASDTMTVTLRDGADLAVQRSGEGPALLLLAGQSNDHTWWDDLRGAYETHFTTITFDYRGTGATSAKEEDGWSTASFARDACAVLDACDVGSAHVYGTSMGGRVAQVLAAEHPDRVDRLVLAATSPGGPLAAERSDDVRRTLAERNPVTRVRALLRLLYTDGWLARGQHSRLTGDPSMTPSARRLHRRASQAHDASELLSAIAAPTLVLHGGDDEVAPVGDAHVLHERIGGSQLHVVETGRHGFFDEFSDDVDERVMGFLSPGGARG